MTMNTMNKAALIQLIEKHAIKALWVGVFGVIFVINLAMLTTNGLAFLMSLILSMCYWVITCKQYTNHTWFRVVLLIWGAIAGLAMVVVPVINEDTMLQSVVNMLGIPKGAAYAIQSFRFLVLGLPVFFILWWFRTTDAQTQITKAQTNINASILSNGMNLLVSTELAARRMGLLSLLQLKRDEPDLAQQVDQCTQGLNLPHVNLTNANLQGADLKNAELLGAHLQGAKYDRDTQFPEGFDPEQHKMVLVDG